MSKTKSFLEIIPPPYQTINEESGIVRGVECPTCDARGFMFECNPRGRTPFPCNRCNGTGYLMARIRILWQPDDNSNQLKVES